MLLTQNTDLRVGLSHFATECVMIVCVQVSQAEHPTAISIQGKHLCAPVTALVLLVLSVRKTAISYRADEVSLRYM